MNSNFQDSDPEDTNTDTDTDSDSDTDEDAMACAIEPDTGDCYWFNDLCFPDDWEVDIYMGEPYDHPACAPGFNDYYEAVHCS